MRPNSGVIASFNHSAFEEFGKRRSASKATARFSSARSRSTLSSFAALYQWNAEKMRSVAGVGGFSNSPNTEDRRDVRKKRCSSSICKSCEMFKVIAVLDRRDANRA